MDAQTPLRGPRNAALIAVAAAAVALGAPAAEAGTIAYQCGGTICTIDPDQAGAKPKTGVATGRLAGLSRDGKILSWVPATGGLIQGNASGGGARQVYAHPIVNQPSMSPDGRKYMWWYPGPDTFGGLTSRISTNQLTVGNASTNGVAFCGGCVTSHGWLGASTGIMAFPRGTSRAEPDSKICRVGTAAESPPGFKGSCIQRLIVDTRGGIGFPSGNAAGTEIVAALTAGAVTGVQGRIVRYSVASGGPIADVTTGTDDTTPVFSPEGDRIAFERSGKIVVRDLAGGAERILAAGVYPFWGGSRGASGAAVSSRSLRYRKGRVKVAVECRGLAACRGRARLKKGKATLAGRSYRIKAGRTATVSLKPSRRGRRTLARARKHRVAVELKPSRGKATTKKLTLRR